MSTQQATSGHGEELGLPRHGGIDATRHFMAMHVRHPAPAQRQNHLLAYFAVKAAVASDQLKQPPFLVSFSRKYIVCLWFLAYYYASNYNLET